MEIEELYKEQTGKKLEYADDYIEWLEEKLIKINNWCKAYPLQAFPEPDFKKAQRVLTENNISLDSISASNMRHIILGIQKIIKGVVK